MWDTDVGKTLFILNALLDTLVGKIYGTFWKNFYSRLSLKCWELIMLVTCNHPHLLLHTLVPMWNISCHKPIPRERVVHGENTGIMWLICWLGCNVVQWGPSCVYTWWKTWIIRTYHRVTAMLNVSETSHQHQMLGQNVLTCCICK
jgi:hypothetical protein